MTLDASAAAGGGGAPSLTAADVARLVGGRIAEGADESRRVVRVAPLARAERDELTFLASGKYAAAFAATRAGIALVSPELESAPGAEDTVRIIVARPHEALLSVLPALYVAAARVAGVHPTAVLGRGVTLGDGVSVGPYAVIGADAVLGERAWVESHCVVGHGVRLGDDAHLFSQVTLYAGTTIGKRVVIHSGARVGSDGFGYTFGDGAHRKIPHVGRCMVEDDVEIGANTTIDRGSVDDTVIGAGTKIDNLVHVGHNVRIGRLCLVMAQVGISGSTTVEDGVVLAGQAGIGGHLTIGARARIAGQSGVFGDVPAGQTYSGYPARPHREAMRATAATFRMATLMKRVERLLEESERPPSGADDRVGGRDT